MLAGAFDMKTRFQYAAMVSAIYSEVSSTFVLPEVARLTTLELHIERTDAQLEEKVLELAKNRRTVGKSAADLVVQVSNYQLTFGSVTFHVVNLV